MALTSDEIPSVKTDEINLFSSENQPSLMEHEQIELNNPTPLSIIMNEDHNSPTTINPINYEEKENIALIEQSTMISSNEARAENNDNQRQNRSKARSVSFAPTVQEFEIPSNRCISYPESSPSNDYLDALVESYKLQISSNQTPLFAEKKYVPKTSHSRLNPNWREHRIRHFMNKLEELNLWDYDQELKAIRAQSSRDQKLEQINDRQRNQNIYFGSMRQRHGNDLENALLLDSNANNINNESRNEKIQRAKSLSSLSLNYDSPQSPYNTKRNIQQEQNDSFHLKTPMGRFRQFETKMTNRFDKINQNYKSNRHGLHSLNSHRSPIPATYVPLFNETYSALLSLPDAYLSNSYNQRRYGLRSNTSQHAASPDFERRIRSHSNRDVRVPLKEQVNNSNDNRNLGKSSNLSKLATTSSSNHASILKSTPNQYKSSSNSSQDSLLINDLHAIEDFSNETSKRILENIIQKATTLSNQNNKHVTFSDENDNDLSKH